MKDAVREFSGRLYFQKMTTAVSPIPRVFLEPHHFHQEVESMYPSPSVWAAFVSALTSRVWWKWSYMISKDRSEKCLWSLDAHSWNLTMVPRWNLRISWKGLCGEEQRSVAHVSTWVPCWQPVLTCQPSKWITLRVHLLALAELQVV